MKMVLLPSHGAVTHEWGGVGGQHNSLGPFVGPAWVVSDRKATRLILTACRGATWELESPDTYLHWVSGEMKNLQCISVQQKDQIKD